MRAHAVRVAAVVIEHAISEIRILLNFAEHHARADGVRGAGRNEDGVARAQRNVLQAIFSRTIFDGALEIFPG